MTDITCIGIAKWLLEHKPELSIEKIASYCSMHPIEIRAIFDGYIHTSVYMIDPISCGDLTHEEIDSWIQSDTLPNPKKLKVVLENTAMQINTKGYKRAAVCWLIKNYPKIANSNICTLVSTSHSTIRAARLAIENKTAEYVDPVRIGLCTKADIERLLGN